MQGLVEHSLEIKLSPRGEEMCLGEDNGPVEAFD